MKTILLLFSVLSIAFSSNALNLHGFTKEEKVAIKTIVKYNKQQEIVEISKGSNTDNKIVIEFTNKMYVLNNLLIESIYVLGDGDWIELQGLDEALNSEYTEGLPAYIFNYDEGLDEQRVEIQPINGTPSWNLYYQYSFYDPRIQATVYVSDDASVTVGDNYVIYRDSLDDWKFSIPECDESIVKY